MIKLFRISWLQQLSRAENKLPYLPTQRLIWLFLAGIVPILFLTPLFGWQVMLLMNLALFLFSLIDLVRVPSKQKFSCQRSIIEELERGHETQVHVHVACKSYYTGSFKMVDSLPPSFSHPFPLTGKINGNIPLSFHYPTTPSVRGEFILNKVFLRFESPFGLWEKQINFEIPARVRVIPNMNRVRSHLSSVQRLLLEHGSRVKRNWTGSGEFSQVRNYVLGDDPRKINWRQSAKRTELMSNVYEPEHGKHISILLDCGRVMGVELKDSNRLERSLEAALTVSAVALQQGDYVSVLAFAEKVKVYIPPGKGLAHLRTILKQVYSLNSAVSESNYAAALTYLESVQKRQSFVLIFSDPDPFIYSKTPLLYVQRLRRKNPVAILGITDPVLLHWVKQDIFDTHQAFMKSMAQKDLLYRKQARKRADKLGISILDVPEDKLAAEAVSRYFDIINRGALS